MNQDSKYSQFALVREMMQTPAILGQFRLEDTDRAVRDISDTGGLFFTGEGSSRIFPAKNAIAHALRKGLPVRMATDGGRQSMEYALERFVVFGASNSGQTRELVEAFVRLSEGGHRKLYGLTANENTKLASVAGQTFVLRCGKERAVAATKSVAEQALFYYALVEQVRGISVEGRLAGLAQAFEAALTASVDPEITSAVANAGTIYFSGRNDGVAEELTLKTNEITRKKSDYLEGTYAVHGIEEVLNPDDVVIAIDPFEAETEKMRQSLVQGVGMKVFAVASRATVFPTLEVPDCGDFAPFVHLAAGWNILVDAGIMLGINLDKPVRARKIGNEFQG